jgi:membrane protein implicated in regulation of membrane protease activity
MTWTDFYLVCFVLGLALSVLSFLGNLHLHLPFPFHIGHLHVGTPHPHGVGGAGEFPAINFGTVTAFLAWFGGIGYLVTRHSHIYAFGALVIAAFGGIVGASVIFLVVGKVLMRDEPNIDPSDYDVVGMLGRVVSSIREGGTGEIIYTQMGVRQTSGARSENGAAIAKGTEIVVTRYEKGIAYVRPWDEMQRELDNKQSGVSS